MPDIFSEAVLALVFINMLIAWSFWFPLACGQLSLATPGAVAVGAYTSSSLAEAGTEDLGPRVLLAGLVGLAFMLVVAPLALRLSGYPFALATLGVAEGVRLIFSNLEYFGGPAGIVGTAISDYVLPVAGIACLVLFVVSRGMFRGGVGRMVDAVAQDGIQAQALGIPTHAIRFFSLAVQGLVASVAGALLSATVGYIDPSMFGIGLHIDVFAFVVVGGVHTFVGPFFGAALLTLALDAFESIGDVRYIAFGALILLIMLVRRDGFLVRLRIVQRRRITALLRDVAPRSKDRLGLGVNRG